MLHKNLSFLFIKFQYTLVLFASLALVILSSCKSNESVPTAKGFKGVIKLDVRESTPDWNPYTPKKAPEGSPNVLFILYDDTGLASWSPYGGRINMPTLDKLAANGLTYTQWHTCALCSPTRSTILTGRNHHLNGMASITEGISISLGQRPLHAEHVRQNQVELAI